MNLSKAARWLIKQALGTKRGDAVIALLSGSLGIFIDLVLGGKITSAVEHIDKVVDQVTAFTQIPPA